MSLRDLLTEWRGSYRGCACERLTSSKSGAGVVGLQPCFPLAGSAEGDGDGGAVMAAGVRDSAAAKLAHILHDAWLTALQVHPSQHPCASVLFVDDGDYAVQTLAPSPRDDLHQVLMDPIKYLRLKRGAPS